MSKPKTDKTVTVDVGLDKLGAALSRFADSAERLLDAKDDRSRDKSNKQVEDWFILVGGHDDSNR